VFAQDFKSCGPAYGGPVGSIPTHFRQYPYLQWPVVSESSFSATHHPLPSNSFDHEPKKAQTVQRYDRSQTPGAIARGVASRGSNAREQAKEAAQAQKARKIF